MVVIETPKGSPNKLAFEPRYGTFVLKGVLPAGAVFPFDFGFVPSTRAEDGNPLDVLVVCQAHGSGTLQGNGRCRSLTKGGQTSQS